MTGCNNSYDVYIILGQPALSCGYCSLMSGARAEATATQGPRSPRLPGLKIVSASVRVLYL